MGWKIRADLGAMNKAPMSSRRYVRLSDDRESRREDSSHGRTRKGYVPVMVGAGDGVNGERFLIPAQLLGDPSIVSLLEMSAEEFGYEQEGVLRIPCQPDCFREIINHLPFKTS